MSSWEGAEKRLLARKQQRLDEIRTASLPKPTKGSIKCGPSAQFVPPAHLRPPKASRKVKAPSSAAKNGSRDLPLSVPRAEKKPGLPSCARMASAAREEKQAAAEREMRLPKVREFQAKRAGQVKAMSAQAKASMLEKASSGEMASWPRLPSPRKGGKLPAADSGKAKSGGMTESKRKAQKDGKQMPISPDIKAAETKRKVSVWKKEDIDACLLAHNKLRAFHGVPPLTWRFESAEDALEAAEACSRENKLHHSNHEGQGQNCAMNYTSFGEAVDAWYSEVSDYDYKKPDFSSDTGHFTQVVWKGTTAVGMARDASGKFIVANYYPPGNFRGQFEQQVPPIKKFDAMMFRDH